MSTPIWQEAWQRFQQVFCHEKNLDCNQYLPVGREKEEEFFWKMVKFLRQKGVKIIFKNQIETQRDFSGKLFRPKGLCTVKHSPYPGVTIFIASPKRSARILSHEFAHIIDFSTNGFMGLSWRELTAAAAGYLFTCEHLGLYSPAADVRYTIKQGAALADPKCGEKHFLEIFHKMNSLFHEKSTTPLF